MVFFLQADLPGLVEGLKALPSDGEGIISLYQLPNVVTQGGLVSLSFMFEIRSVFVVSCLECACGYSRVKDRNICYRYLLVLQFMFYGNSVILCRYLEYLKMVCTFRSLLRPPPPHSSQQYCRIHLNQKTGFRQVSRTFAGRLLHKIYTQQCHLN